MPDNWRNYFRSDNPDWDTIENWNGKDKDVTVFKDIIAKDKSDKTNFFTEDEDEDYAKLIDAMPHMQNFVYDFRGVLNRGLINQKAYDEIIAALKEFTIPSIQYETHYPDVVTMSFDVESIVANAKNQIDMAFSTFLQSNSINDNHFEQGRKYLDQVIAILSDESFKPKLEAL